MIAQARRCHAETGAGSQRPMSTTKEVQQNEPVDFESYVQCHQAEVFSIVIALTGDSLRADTIAQMVFVEAHRVSRKPFWRLPTRLRLCELAVELALADREKRRIEPRRDRAVSLLNRLKKEDRVLLVLRDVQAHSISELSALYGLGEDEIRRELLCVRRRAVALKPAER